MNRHSQHKDPVQYLQRVLSLSPVESATKILNRRAYHLGIRKPIKPVSEEDLQRKRGRAEEQINQIRKDFWTTNVTTLNQSIKAVNAKDFPELQTALDRLKMVSTFRSDFETLGTHPAKVDNLLLALKRLVIVPPKQAGALKESYLKKVADGKALKDIQKMVAVIRKEFPNLYRMEADFLDSVAKVKGRYVSPESASSGPMIDFEIPAWIIYVGVFLIIRILTALAMRG